jgi:protein-tyrosine phosphatase
MIDFHCHILPGLDDGARNLDESLEMARILSGSGFTEAYCTPHLIKGCFDNNKDDIVLATNALQAALRQQNIALTLHSGVEYYLDEFFSAHLKDPLALGGSTYVLVEAPVQAGLEFVKENIFTIVRSGYVPLVAHPERCGFLDSVLRHSPFTVHSSPFTIHRDGLWNMLRDRFSRTRSVFTEPARGNIENGTSGIDILRDMGCKFQVNIGSFTGMYGNTARKRAIGLLQNGVCDKLGTDAHSPQDLKKRLGRGLKIIEQEIGKESLKKLVS